MRLGLCAIVKNEAPYLIDWIAWYSALGFTEFIIADNESDDGTTEILKAFKKRRSFIHSRSRPDFTKIRKMMPIILAQLWQSTLVSIGSHFSIQMNICFLRVPKSRLPSFFRSSQVTVEPFASTGPCMGLLGRSTHKMSPPRIVSSGVPRGKSQPGTKLSHG